MTENGVLYDSNYSSGFTDVYEDETTMFSYDDILINFFNLYNHINYSK